MLDLLRRSILRAAALALLLLLAAPAWAQVAVNTSATATETGQDASISLTINTSGANRLLDCAVLWAGSANTVTSVTHNGVALAESAIGQVSEVAAVFVNAFLLVAQATGVQTVTATLSGTGSNKSLACIASTGVDQTTPHGAGAEFSDTANPMTATITVPTSGLGVFFCINAQENNTFTPGSGQTEPFADFPDTDANFQSMASYTASTGSQVMTFSNSTGNYGACIALPINPAAAVAAARASRPIFFH